MPRPPRIVIPGVAHHVVQRGNRKQPIFFDDADRRAYLRLLVGACARHSTRCLAWCLMDNHVHLVLVPAREDGLRAPLASAHTAYSQHINRTRSLTGHLFQGRFASYPMGDAHLMAAVRYVENNPVAAGLVARAELWPWSSAKAHVERRPDGLTDVEALGVDVANWSAMLACGLEAGDRDERVEQALRGGRPPGEARPRGRPRKMGTPPKKGDCPLFPLSGASPAPDTIRRSP